jgi:hypothetical protein
MACAFYLRGMSNFIRFHSLAQASVVSAIPSGMQAIDDQKQAAFMAEQEAAI